MAAALSSADNKRLLRFITGGLFAASVHFAVLVFAVEIAGIHSAGLASGLAACAGIATSFFTNRLFVFRSTSQAILAQGYRFVLLYATLALFHGGVLFLWADLGGLDYRIGFLVATTAQTFFSYLGNQHLVFK